MISLMCSGAGFVVSGVGMFSRVGMIGLLFGLMLVLGAIIRFE